MQESLQFDEIRITGPFIFTQIEAILISEKVNEHGRMTISGLINEEAAQEWLDHPLKDGVISICDHREQRPLFTGLIEAVALNETGRIYHVTVDCVSFTKLWDRSELDGSFQDKTMRYIDVLQAAGKLGGVKGAVIATADRSRESIGKPVFIYQETVWNFIKRIAGRLQTIVIPEVTYGFPQLCVGCVKGKKYEEDDVQDYQELLDLDGLRRRQGPKGKWQFISYRIKCGRNYELGDKVQFKGKELIVMQKELKLEQGSLEGSYVLGYEEGFCLPENPNRRIRGASLEGTVIDTKEGMVKLHLDIDTEQEKERACWFRYTPVTGDIMYSVPECGARVFLNVMDEEENVSVSGCIRRQSEVLPGPEVKTLWVGSKKYIAAPEYMGFASEQKESMDALFMDDELGVVIHTGKKLKIDSQESVVFHAKGNVVLDSTVRTILKHPNGEEEQAYIEMDCANMKLGGKEIVQSGGETSEISEIEYQAEPLSEQENAKLAIGMVPMSLSDIKENIDEYIVMTSASTDIGSREAEQTGKKEGGGVTSGSKSIDSENDGEKKANIYLNGYKFTGYVYGENTYVDNYDDFISYAFGANGIPKSGRKYDIESMVSEMGMDNVFSSWEQSEDLRIIICNTDAKIAHLKINRIGTELKIHLYTKILYKKESEGVEFKDASLNETDLSDDGSTVTEVFEKGVKLWEGTYQNKESKDTGIVYDDFGIDGLVNVKVEVHLENDYRTENNIPGDIKLDEGEGNDYQKFFLAALIYNPTESFKGEVSSGDLSLEGGDENRSRCRTYRNYYYRKAAIMLAYRFYWGILFGLGYKSDSKYSDFLHMLAHETGHIFGLGDAYDRSRESSEDNSLKAMKGAKITDEIPKDDMMINNTTVTPNDVEMVLEAWRSIEEQEFYTAESIGYKKSPVIRQNKKDKKNWF